MPTLRELQHDFAAALLEGDTAVRAHVRPGRFDPARHVNVYRNNAYTTLTEALGDIHPAVRRLVGDDFFGYAAERYIATHPPASGNLHEFGAEFAEFLASFEPVASLVYLPDVARLEWAWHEAFHAADASPLALETLARVAPGEYPRLRLRLHPSARLVASPYPVLRIREVSQPGVEGDERVSLEEGGQRVLVIRRGLSVELADLAEAEFVLLSSCRAALTFEETADAVSARQPDFDLSAVLCRYVADGTIVEFSLR